MFEAEAEGLLEMANSNTIKVPSPVCYGEYGNQCYIVMEYLDLGGSGDNALSTHDPEREDAADAVEKL